MIGILIIAHSKLGESLIECAAHVLGSRPPLLEQLGIQTNDDPGTILPRALQMVESLNQGDGVLVLSDMYGATPCNIVGKLLVPGKIEGVSGVNLPMLVRALTYRNGDILALAQKAFSGGHEGVMHFTEEACKGLQKRHD